MPQIRKNLVLSLWIVALTQCVATFLFIISRNGISHTSLTESRAIVRLLDQPDGFVSLLYFVSVIWIILQRRKLRNRSTESLGYRWHRIVLGVLYPTTIPLFFAFDIERLKQVSQENPISRQQLRSLKTSWIGYSWFATSAIFFEFGFFDEVGNVIDYFTIGPSNMTDPTRYALKFIDPNQVFSKLDQYSMHLWAASAAYCVVLALLACSSWFYLRYLRKANTVAVAPLSDKKNARYRTIIAISLGILFSYSSISAYQTETSDTRAINTPTSTNIPNVAMVDVLCMNLQDAQNLIQDQGVFLSRSKDASGQDRNQIYDRNWIVVGQNIPTGDAIGENEVVLSVLRDNEIDKKSECFGKTK